MDKKRYMQLAADWVHRVPKDVAMQKLLDQCNDDADLFIEKLLESKDWAVRQNYIYAQASKEMPGHWLRLRDMIGEHCKKVYADAGSLKVGNDIWSARILNGRGDGTVRYAVMNEGNFNSDMATFSLSIEGKFHIYSYDCGDDIADDIAETLEGKFMVFVYDGIVVFMKMEEKN